LLMTLQRKAKIIRKSRGLTQAEFAGHLQVSPRVYWSWEAGEKIGYLSQYVIESKLRRWMRGESKSNEN
jgi:transcriptional regulator with XRE-family HTH domain